MKVAVFSSKGYDRQFLDEANQNRHELTFFEPRLAPETARLASGFDVVCSFVNDDLGEAVLRELHGHGVKLLALRSAGFNNVDLAVAKELGLPVVRVPAYSPHAVAEHTLALILSLNRKVHHAFNRVREGNFELEGLLGFDLHGKTAGVIGTGKIGVIVANLLSGFGCKVLAHDPCPNSDCQAEYVELDELLGQADLVSLHMPLTKETHHLIGKSRIDAMKRGVMLINTSRGGLIDTACVIEGLKLGKIGYLGLDVYEEEADLFFENHSGAVIQDDVFARLLTFPNVLITGHQAFFTREALTQIAQTTLASISAFERDEPLENRVPGS